MAATQEDLRARCAQLSREIKALHSAIADAYCADEVSLAMHREATAYLFCARSALDSAKYVLGEFQPKLSDTQQAEEASHR